MVEELLVGDDGGCCTPAKTLDAKGREPHRWSALERTGNSPASISAIRCFTHSTLTSLPIRGRGAAKLAPTATPCR
jgi:hypothetical protein